MKRAIAVLIAFFLVLAAAVFYFQTGSGKGGGAAVGNAPDFTLTDTDGNRFSLSDFGGRVVLLDLMATWCGPCVLEIAHLKNVQQRYAGEVVILSISVAWGGDTSQGLAAFKEEQECDWTFAVDSDDVAVKYGVTAIPKLVIIDKGQNIRFTHLGVTPSSTLVEEIDGLI